MNFVVIKSILVGLIPNIAKAIWAKLKPKKS